MPSRHRATTVPQFTVAVLLFGDYPKLAERCLSSLRRSLPSPRVADFRLGMNAVCAETRRIAENFAKGTADACGVPVTAYDCLQNRFKYPLMRKMLHGSQLASWTVWFDDDSYLTVGPEWWDWLAKATEAADMLGKIYHAGASLDRNNWVKRQPWYSGDLLPLEHHGKPAFKFATGGWWAIRSQILTDWDWPSRELVHRGGDSMLGELLRQRNYRLVDFHHGVRINADESGIHSTAPRRPPGSSRVHPLLGSTGNVVDDRETHNFTPIVREY